MPRALAIETSGRIGSIALVEHGAVCAEQSFEHGLQHAAMIIPIIDQMTRDKGWKPAEIQQLYVSAGPGSFTGLRIGVTLAKVLAATTGAKIVAVPSVRVLVENAPDEARNVIIVLDAKREQIFTARYSRQSAVGSRQWVENEPAHLDSLSRMMERAPKPVHLLGEGIPYHRKFIPNDPEIIVTDDSLWRARASAVARIGMRMAQAGEFADPFQFTPIYIRRPEAEEKWEQLHGK